MTTDTRPWWATFVVNVGVPATIALVLVWWLMTRFEDRLVKLEDRQNTAEKMLTQTLQIMQDAAESMHDFAQRAEQERVHRDMVLRQICLNTSKGSSVAVCAQ